jgi:hypothetical protein
MEDAHGELSKKTIDVYISALRTDRSPLVSKLCLIDLCPFRDIDKIVPAAKNEEVTSIRFDVLNVDPPPPLP